MIHFIRLKARICYGWEGGKAVALSGKKRKLKHVTEHETDILLEPRSPFSLREFNFLPLSQAQLARKTSLIWHKLFIPAVTHSFFQEWSVYQSSHEKQFTVSVHYFLQVKVCVVACFGRSLTCLMSHASRVLPKF